ncbi:hypothetical protein [Paraburkholderia hospita]|uniref:hypothetical protein n=1 Tax=Paraburkholderia hospita TaxID=169430 RepID=UPI003ECC5386
MDIDGLMFVIPKLCENGKSSKNLLELYGILDTADMGMVDAMARIACVQLEKLRRVLDRAYSCRRASQTRRVFGEEKDRTILSKAARRDANARHDSGYAPTGELGANSRKRVIKPPTLSTESKFTPRAIAAGPQPAGQAISQTVLRIHKRPVVPAGRRAVASPDDNENAR